MKSLQTLYQGTNFSAVNVGEFDNLMEYSFLHPKLQTEVKGKVFVGEILKSTGAEVSFQFLAPHTGIPFLHQHKNHEEIYIILKGSGQFRVDDFVFDINEGSVIRIAPDGKRSLRNNSGTPLIYMCIQTRQNTLDNFLVFDGFRTRGETPWNDMQP